jgi:hypothetical protein
MDRTNSNLILSIQGNLSWGQKEIWTVEYLVDRLFFEMLELNYGADQPPPVFVINKSDLTLRLRSELAGLKKGDTLDYVVSEAIGRVCENQNARLYHLTLKKRLGWRFDN